MLYTFSMLLVQPLQTEMSFSSKYSVYVHQIILSKIKYMNRFIESKDYKKVIAALNTGNYMSQKELKVFHAFIS